MHHVAIIKNNKKQDMWFDTREEAEKFLEEEDFISEVMNKVPNKGMDIRAKARIMIDSLTNYHAKQDKLDERIVEWVKPGK